jgi:hypothetical protein
MRFQTSKAARANFKCHTGIKNLKNQRTLKADSQNSCFLPKNPKAHLGSSNCQNSSEIHGKRKHIPPYPVGFEARIGLRMEKSRSSLYSSIESVNPFHSSGQKDGVLRILKKGVVQFWFKPIREPLICFCPIANQLIVNLLRAFFKSPACSRRSCRIDNAAPPPADRLPARGLSRRRH